MASDVTSEAVRYQVEVEGTVQDVGLRDFVEDLGRERGLGGYVFNNGTSVIIVLDGPENEVSDFIQEVWSAEDATMADISGINKEEVSTDSAVPSELTKLPTDDLGDIGRKLDKGVRTLSSMDEKQEFMVGNQESMEDYLRSIDERQEAMVSLLDKIEGHLDSSSE